MHQSFQGRLAAGMLILLAVLGTGCKAALPVQSDESVDAAPEQIERQRLQVGKLIKKRQIAPLTSITRAAWLTRPERDAEQQPDRVVAELKIPKGATVVDLGAGVGYFTWRLARQVGPTGRVIAVDIQQGMLDLLQANLRDRRITNTKVVLASPDDPHLPVGEVDLVLLVQVYSELQHPEKTMEHIRRSLKPDGRAVLIEYRQDGPTIPVSPLRRMSVEEVRSELEPMGFQFVEVMNFLPSQNILIFKDRKSR